MNFGLNKNIFGLDISDGALRLVQLEKRGKKLILASYNDLVVPPGIIINGEIKQEEKLIELIKKIVKSCRGKKITTKNVIAVLPESKTFIKVIEINTNDKAEIPTLINEEIKNHIPMSLEEIYLDWQIVGQNSNAKKILIGAAPKNIVDSYILILEKSGLIPYILEIEAAAIIRSLLTEKDKTTKIIIDFGAARTGLIIYDHQTIQFTVSLPISGNKITETIAKTLQLDPDKAEEAKIVCGLDPQKCEGALLKILLESIDNLVEQITKATLFYKTNFPQANLISEIIICGGGANFLNISQVLSERLKIPVKISNPFINVIQKKKLAIPANKALSYTTAIGLAMRAFQKKDLI